MLCTLAQLEPTGAKGLTLADGREIVVVASPEGPRAYLNSCPHNGVTLEILPDRFLNADRSELVCTAHGARFLVGTGYCVGGPCAGRSLTAIAVAVADGAVVLA
jgi:nitrite reductase/ring-hydroxylating ferredoxin subunit